MTAIEKLNNNGIALKYSDIEEVALKYKIKEISVFGSSITNYFNINSDIDLLIEFLDSESISLFDLMDIQEYFEKITKRSVDLVEPEGLKNPYRRKNILESREVLYVA
jgi:predicted nucleotidyltransferase